jgi:eukaryotic-like serine/threonine-protein kinase
MGEVWEGRDSRLDRRVAIKVSREQFSDRFDREARAVAALNHPHICTLHDVGPDYLVMEFIEGKPLAGPLPVADAFRAAIQIADALEAAHRHGITHRDLKPANVLVTRSGVKLLDFGLAKLHAPGDGQQPLVDRPTALVTGTHTVMGTLQYMSPEQLQGLDVDARSDIFSFGLVLHEIFTGQLPAERSGVIAAEGARAAVPSVPPGVSRLIRTCLADDPADRFQSASDLKRALEWTRDDVPRQAPAPARAHWLAWAGTAAAVLAAMVLALWPRPAGPAEEVTRFSVLPAPGTNFPPASNATVSAAQLALSPDGRALVFVAVQRNDRPVLWLRSMDDTEPRPIAGSDGASYPFWSPDNKWIGFFADGKIKKVLAAGGPAQVISASENNLSGATWGPQDIILLGNPIGPIKKVSASGGPIEDVTALQPDRKEVNHRWPQFLPDGRHFLYVVRASLPGQPRGLRRIARRPRQEATDPVELGGDVRGGSPALHGKEHPDGPPAARSLRGVDAVDMPERADDQHAVRNGRRAHDHFFHRVLRQLLVLPAGARDDDVAVLVREAVAGIDVGPCVQRLGHAGHISRARRVPQLFVERCLVDALRRDTEQHAEADDDQHHGGNS